MIQHKLFNAFRNLVAFLFLIVYALPTGAQTVKPATKDLLLPAYAATLSGYIGAKLDSSFLNRIIAQNEEKLVEPFRNRTEASCWQSEFWGKWFTSAVLAYKYKPDPALRKLLDKAVADLISTQTSDGYIGNYAPDKHLQQWDVWGRKYCMLGLISYYDITKDIQSLKAAQKIANHLIGELHDKNILIVKAGNHRGMAASSVLEPIVLLYNRTGDKRYLDFAGEIVKEWESSDGPQLISKSLTPVGNRFPRPEKNWYGWEQGQKAYEMMSCYEGLLELYRTTANEKYLTAVENTWESINNSEINIAGSGSAMECWFGGAKRQTQPVKHYQETCVTATWIKLNQQLLRLTGKAKYADAIEQTFYNALLGSMFPNGSDWAKYSPLSGERLRGSEQCKMGINCCVASGPRGLFTIPLTVIMNQADGIRLNFFIPGKYDLKTPTSKSVSVEQSTTYPASGEIELKISLTSPEKFILSIRNPSWSLQSIVLINGDSISVSQSGSYTSINRLWRNGDKIKISLDMRGRLIKGGASNEYFSIARGPLVLARDMRLGSPDTDEALTPMLNKEGYLDLIMVEDANSNYWVRFKMPVLVESHQEGGPQPVDIVLCDYASAGNTFNAQSRFRVWIPALFDPVK